HLGITPKIIWLGLILLAEVSNGFYQTLALYVAMQGWAGHVQLSGNCRQLQIFDPKVHNRATYCI
ncbi:hypothetical protein K5M49_01950, partial [Serratia marcescens]|nr:hypothetical protein [Serratia marcescens]